MSLPLMLIAIIITIAFILNDKAVINNMLISSNPSRLEKYCLLLWGIVMILMSTFLVIMIIYGLIFIPIVNF